MKDNLTLYDVARIAVRNAAFVLVSMAHSAAQFALQKLGIFHVDVPVLILIGPDVDTLVTVALDKSGTNLHNFAAAGSDTKIAITITGNFFIKTPFGYIPKGGGILKKNCAETTTPAFNI